VFYCSSSGWLISLTMERLTWQERTLLYHSKWFKEKHQKAQWSHQRAKQGKADCYNKSDFWPEIIQDKCRVFLLIKNSRFKSEREKMSEKVLSLFTEILSVITKIWSFKATGKNVKRTLSLLAGKLFLG